VVDTDTVTRGELVEDPDAVEQGEFDGVNVLDAVPERDAVVVREPVVVAELVAVAVKALDAVTVGVLVPTTVVVVLGVFEEDADEVALDVTEDV